MKIKIIKENIMKEQKARPAILYVGGVEFMGQAQAHAKLNDIETGKTVHSVSKSGKDLAALKKEMNEELKTWAASNGYQITKIMEDK
jgi:hypothetical protein